FSPRRWEGISPSIYEYLPFGAGPRMCLGAGFAAMAVRIILPVILGRRRLSMLPGARVSRQLRGITMEPKHGLPVKVSARNGARPRAAPVRGDVHDLVDLS